MILGPLVSAIAGGIGSLIAKKISGSSQSHKRLDCIIIESEQIVTLWRTGCKKQKKMYLVDQRTFEKLNNPDTWQKPIIDIMQKLQRREDTTWSRPPIKRSKAFVHKDKKRILGDPSLSPDDKIKLYSQNLIRFSNMNKGRYDNTRCASR